MKKPKPPSTEMKRIIALELQVKELTDAWLNNERMLDLLLNHFNLKLVHVPEHDELIPIPK